ncbi:hypothetical protein DL96DRAFT_1812465 [Flagelloscypha sp. PMI_526]|nr:hypothetical protein DL96DRAFT_1812465 [Flagelloscypha sp. PMI_526]
MTKPPCEKPRIFPSYTFDHVLISRPLSCHHEETDPPRQMVFGYTSYEFYLYSKAKGYSLLWVERLLPALKPEHKDLAGKTAIVTGANTGIGLELARGLALRGATVVLACRNRGKAEGAKEDIVASARGSIREEQIEIKLLDVSDLSSVRSFVQEWGTRPLDILLNNAGITTGTFTKSPQGYEHTYTTNILSHYLLTLSLLPHFRTNGRIVNVSSATNYDATPFDLLDLDYSKEIEGQGIKEGEPLSVKLTSAAYARTKCMQVLFTRELQQRLGKSATYKNKGITVHVYHPGLVLSTVWKKEGTFSISERKKRFIRGLVNIIGISTTEGAATGIHLAVSDAAAKTPGMYWNRMVIVGPNRLVEDVETRKLVFDQLAIESELDEALRV